MSLSKILIIGGAVADISLYPVDASIFERHSTPLSQIPLSTGGDALNEASVLARLGVTPRLVTLLGADTVGEFILSQCAKRGIDTADSVCDPTIPTSVNVVLVDEHGERRFVTARSSSLRCLAPQHVNPVLQHLNGVEIVSFASIFVSPRYGAKELEALFCTLKQKGVTLCADMTQCKNGETAEDLRGALEYVDFLFPNLHEGALLTGKQTPEEIVRCLLDCGVKCVVLKLGSDGCLVAAKDFQVSIPVYPNAQVVDTTGAGDTFAAAFLYALSQGSSVLQCTRFATAAASVCVEQIGCGSEALTLSTVEQRLAYISAK